MKQITAYRMITWTCLFASALFVLSTADAAIDPDSVVGIWLLDEGQGDTAADTSKNHNDGTIVGAEWTDGYNGKALLFDGASHVEIPASASTDDIMDGFTYLVWVKPTAAPPNENTRIVERDWHNPTIQIGATNYYGSIAVNADQAATNVRGGAWKVEQWNFVALTYDGGDLRLYVDGEMVGEKNVGKPDSKPNNTPGGQQNAIWFGSWKAAGWDFTGVIDEVGVFNVALEDTELASIMDSGLAAAAAVSPTHKLATVWAAVKE